MLAQAQRIAYDVQQIDRAFSTSYAPVTGSQSNQVLITNAQSRWQNSVAALQDALRVQAGVVGNLDTNRIQTSALSNVEPRCQRRPAGNAGRQSDPRAATRSSSPISPPPWRHRAGRRASKRRSAPRPRIRDENSSGAF